MEEDKSVTRKRFVTKYFMTRGIEHVLTEPSSLGGNFWILKDRVKYYCHHKYCHENLREAQEHAVKLIEAKRKSLKKQLNALEDVERNLRYTLGPTPLL